MSDQPEPRNPYTADAATLDRWERQALRCLTSDDRLTRDNAGTFLAVIWAARERREVTA